MKNERMGNKQRVMKVLKYLKENTNEKHCVNSSDILSALNITADRKTIYSDIKELNELGFDIKRIDKRDDLYSSDDKTSRLEKVGYYYDGESIEVSALRIIIDELKANAFLPKSKTIEIINELLKLTNKYDRKLLGDKKKNIINFENEKSKIKEDDKSKQFNNDLLQILTAIASKNAIQFKYYDLDVKKGRVSRKNGKNYKVYPYDLVINNNRYYLICNTFGHDGFSNYRLDKMGKVSIIEDATYEETPEFSEYLIKTFSMFSGDSIYVTLRCHKNTYEELSMKFGDSLMVTEYDGGDYFSCHVKVNVSPTFFSWVFTFGGMIQIEKPLDVKNQFIEMCNNMIQAHNG